MTRRGIVTMVALGCIYSAGLAALLALTPARADAPSPFPPGSSFGRSERGAALAAEYLRGRGHRVLPLLSSSVAGVVPGSLIFVIDPKHLPLGSLDPRPLLTLEEERFVRNGGRIVLALGGSVSSMDLKDATSSQPWIRVHPDWPTVNRLDQGSVAKVLTGPWLRDAYTIFAASDQPVVVRKKIGRGDIVAIASPELFENAHLGQAHNLEFLDALTASRPAVYFDEGVHGLGESEGLTDLLREWKLVPFFLTLLTLSMAILIRKGRGLGSQDRDDPPKPEDAVDLVEALGRLYARSLSDDEALALHRDHLRREVSEKTDLRGKALRSRVDTLLANAGSKPKSSTHTFEQELVAINHALRRVHEQPR